MTDPATDPATGPETGPATDLAGHVTPELIADVIEQVAGSRIEVGPMAVGPGGVARAIAHGTLRRADVRRCEGKGLAYEARLPVSIDLAVEATGGRHRFTADLVVPVRVTVSADGDHALIALTPLRPHDVTARVTAHGLRARVLGTVGNVDGELRREVADYVNGRFAGDDVQAHTRIPLPG